MDVTREHVISLVLSEDEWRAFVGAHPQPVAWLRAKIHESIGVDGAISGSSASAPGAGNTTSATTR